MNNRHFAAGHAVVIPCVSGTIKNQQQSKQRPLARPHGSKACAVFRRPAPSFLRCV
jgi:hypothetical protein